MTTFRFDNVTCSFCGAASEQQLLMSTNSFGSPDLDFRPAEMQRSTMSYWLQECPKCGFVSSDLSEPEKGVEEIVASERYRSLHRSGPSEALISRCLRRSLLDEHLGNTANAAEHALWAAWAADDAGDPSAGHYRSRAADLFLACAAALPGGSSEAVMMRTRLVDILRRAERWDEAVSLADTLLATGGLDPTIRSIVEFGRNLAQGHDASMHTVQDAMSGSTPVDGPG
jgi:hypothetical protein